jgi:hypothetical protein
MKQAIYRPLDDNRQPVVGSSVDQLLETTRAALKAAAPAAEPEPAAAAPVATPPRPRASSRAQVAGAIVAGLIVLLATVFIGQSIPTPAPAVPAAALTAAPARPSAPPVSPAAPQSPAPAAATLPRPVGAFAAPDGAYLGIVEAGRAYTPTGRLGIEWTQILAAGSGRVWVKAAELAPAAELPDLATPTARPLPTAPPAPQVIVKEVPAAPQPTQCATVSGGGAVVQRCGSASIEQLEADARAAWRAQFGGNTAPIATMTPYGGKP